MKGFSGFEPGAPKSPSDLRQKEGAAVSPTRRGWVLAKTSRLEAEMLLTAASQGPIPPPRRFFYYWGPRQLALKCAPKNAAGRE